MQYTLLVLVETCLDSVTRWARYQATSSAVALTLVRVFPAAYEATSSAVLIALGSELPYSYYATSSAKVYNLGSGPPVDCCATYSTVPAVVGG